MVRAALAMGFAAHQGQTRKSGEPFITHPVEVTRILAELHVDFESLIAGRKQGCAAPGPVLGHLTSAPEQC